jgi:hypothetical protein
MRKLSNAKMTIRGPSAEGFGEQQKVEEFVNLSHLKASGFSDKLIRDLLGGPDKTRINPHYRRGPRVKLWAASRVEVAKKTAQFLSYQSKRAAASARFKAVAEKKRGELLSQIDDLEISVEIWPLGEVFDAAIKQWDARQLDRGNFDANGRSADDSTKCRWAVNFIRHHLCSYHTELNRIAGKVGVSLGATAIRKKVLSAIAEAYPSLANECRRQEMRRWYPLLKWP